MSDIFDNLIPTQTNLTQFIILEISAISFHIKAFFEIFHIKERHMSITNQKYRA